MKKIAVITTFLIALLISSCQEESKASAGSDSVTDSAGKINLEKPIKPAMPVEVVKITEAEIKREVYASSSAKGIKDSYIISQTGGIIESVDFKFGDYIKKGSLLLSVESEVQKASKDQAVAAVEVAKLNMEISEKLFKNANGSEIEYIAAKSQYEGAKAGLAMATKAYNDCFIKAPFSGYIVSKESSIERGGLLGMGSVVGRIIDISSLKSQFQIGEIEMSIVKEGMEVELSIPAIGNKIIKGKISAISAASDPASSAFPVEVIWKNSDELVKAGMSVNVVIRSDKNDKVLVLPSAAIFNKNGKQAIFVEEDGKAALRFIKTGRASGNLIEVISGVKRRDNLIISGMTVLDGGDAVKANDVGFTGGKE